MFRNACPVSLKPDPSASVIVRTSLDLMLPTSCPASLRSWKTLTGTTVWSSGMTLPAWRSGPRPDDGTRSRYCSPATESSWTCAIALAGMAVPGSMAKVATAPPRAQGHLRDPPDVHAAVGHEPVGIQPAAARKVDGDGERLGAEPPADHVERDEVHPEKGDDDQRTDPNPDLCLAHGSPAPRSPLMACVVEFEPEPADPDDADAFALFGPKSGVWLTIAVPSSESWR